MTMHIHFKKAKDGYKIGWSGYVERSLARRFCREGTAITHQQYLDELYEEEQAKIEELKKKEPVKVERAVSRKPKKAEKSNLARKGANKAR